MNVASAGAKGDGTTNNTAAIQKAIDTCSNGSTSAFGCKVVVPCGDASGDVYVTGSLFLRSQMTFEVQAGATLLGDSSTASFPMGLGKSAGSPPALLNAFKVSDVGGKRRTKGKQKFDAIRKTRQIFASSAAAQLTATVSKLPAP